MGWATKLNPIVVSSGALFATGWRGAPLEKTICHNLCPRSHVFSAIFLDEGSGMIFPALKESGRMMLDVVTGECKSFLVETGIAVSLDRNAIPVNMIDSLWETSMAFHMACGLCGSFLGEFTSQQYPVKWRTSR